MAKQHKVIVFFALCAALALTGTRAAESQTIYDPTIPLGYITIHCGVNYCEAYTNALTPDGLCCQPSIVVNNPNGPYGNNDVVPPGDIDEPQYGSAAPPPDPPAAPEISSAVAGSAITLLIGFLLLLKDERRY